jgi:hypothetical protein
MIEVFMKLTILFAALFLSAIAQAQESLLPMPGKVTAKSNTSVSAPSEFSGYIQSDFFQLPTADKSLVEVSYMTYTGVSAQRAIQTEEGRVDHQIDRSSSGYSFSYLYGISDSLAFGVDGGFLKTTTTEFDGTSTMSNGLRDFGATLAARSPFETFDLVYGVSLALSPETSAGSYGRVHGSNFSGGQAVSPFIGFDGKVGAATVGAKFTTSFATYRNSDSRFGLGSDSRFSFESIGFYEFPIYKPALMGIALSITGNDSAFADNGSRIYGGQAYASVKILDDTTVRLTIEGLSRDSQTDGGMSATQITAALRKSL